MSQDNVRCVKCNKLCGYDDNKGYWAGGDLAVCKQCKNNLISRFCAFFNLGGVSGSDLGLEIEWIDVDRILSKIKRDYAMRESYIVTEKELSERN